MISSHYLIIGNIVSPVYESWVLASCFTLCWAMSAKSSSVVTWLGECFTCVDVVESWVWCGGSVWSFEADRHAEWFSLSSR